MTGGCYELDINGRWVPYGHTYDPYHDRMVPVPSPGITRPPQWQTTNGQPPKVKAS